MREVFVGRADMDPGWTRVLDQERIDHTHEGATTAPVVVLSGALPGWIADFVESGGVAVGARVFAHPQCHHVPEVYDGIGAAAAEGLLKAFFAERRPG